MGFRSTFVSQGYSNWIDKIVWPRWFINKYSETVNIGDCLSSKRDCKLYGDTWSDLLEDIQKVIKKKSLRLFKMVVLHECGGITRVYINPDKIWYFDVLDDNNWSTGDDLIQRHYEIDCHKSHCPENIYEEAKFEYEYPKR